MDVNETLKLLRELIVHQELADSDEQAAAFGWQAAELFQGLDEWLSKGGFLPADWSAKRATVSPFATREV